MNKLLNKLVFAAAAIVASCVLSMVHAGDSHAAKLTVTWDGDPDRAIAGYKVYYGTSSRSYGTPIDVKNGNEYTFTDIEAGKTAYLAVKAYDAHGNESDFSEELVCYSLQPVASANGSILPDQTVFVTSDMVKTFKMVPASGYVVQNVLVDGVSLSLIHI